jgi:hypothetical protein
MPLRPMKPAGPLPPYNVEEADGLTRMTTAPSRTTAPTGIVQISRFRMASLHALSCGLILAGAPLK